MNIALLILAVVTIVISTVLIVLNSDKTSNKVPESTFETYSPKPNIKNVKRETGEDLFYEKMKDEILESPIRTTKVTRVEPLKQKTVAEFEEDLSKTDIKEKDIPQKDTHKVVNLSDESELESTTEAQKRLSVTEDDGNSTEKIIKMKQQGMTNNEIAKSLCKGVREIEIILKINKINN